MDIVTCEHWKITFNFSTTGKCWSLLIPSRSHITYNKYYRNM